MVADELFVDAKIIGDIVGNGESLQAVGDTLDGRGDELEGLHTAFDGAHVEFLARAVGQPVEIGRSFFQPAAVGVGSGLLYVFVWI